MPQQSYLALNDTDPSIGASRLVLSNPSTPSPQSALDHNVLDLLVAQQEAILGYVRSLEERIAALESRTWWSMLKDSVRSIWSKWA